MSTTSLRPTRKSKNGITKGEYKVTAILLYGFKCRNESA